ncbi:MAG: glycosyltransferase family A protein [Gemmatimonadota bacterium]
MRACIITPIGIDLTAGTEELEAILAAAGWQVERANIASGTPRTNKSMRDRIAESFAHTPKPLIDSWDFATKALEHITDVDVVIAGDGSGLAGILALELANNRAKSHQRLWTIAGDSLSLARLHVARTLAAATPEEESIIDWELTQYRFSDRVLCVSDVVRGLLSQMGVEADALPMATRTAQPATRRAGRLYVPGPVSRVNAAPQILRTVADMEEVSVVFGIGDVEDEYWSGTTWQAFEAVRSLEGDRISRSADRPLDTDLLVIGDPFVSHEGDIESAVADGIAIVVPAGSLDAMKWRGVHEWSSEEDLASVITGASVSDGSIPAAPTFDLAHRRTPDPERARRITIGIPVFGASPFLDDLLASIASQTFPPHEVIVMVDGPTAGTVESSVASWRVSSEHAVRIHQQPNRGVCVARNAIMDAMSGDALLLVDQDDVLADDALECLAQALRSNPECDAVAGWTAFFGEYEGIEAKPPFDARVGSRENPIVSTAVLLDRAVVEAGVRFEPDLAFLYCEDWNLWADLVAHDYSIGLVSRPLIRHRVHAASGGFRRAQLALEAGRRRAVSKLC